MITLSDETEILARRIAGVRRGRHVAARHSFVPGNYGRFERHVIAVDSSAIVAILERKPDIRFLLPSSSKPTGL
jgi:hypothetical protein